MRSSWNRPLGVCLISEEMPPETGWGGIGTYTHILASGLAGLGHRVNVIARTWEGDRVCEVNGFFVHRIRVPEPLWRRGSYFWNLRFPESRDILFWNLRVSKILQQIHDRETIDVIETPEYRAQALLSTFRLPKAPLVVKLHTPAVLCRTINGASPGGSRADTCLSEWAEQALVRRANLITSPSRCLAADVARRWGLESARIRVIPNPIDEQMFCPVGPPGSSADVLYVGRLERRKGVETLIDAVPRVLGRVAGARFRLVGRDHPSGPRGESMVCCLSRRLGKSRITGGVVDFTKPVPRTELPGLYRSAAVCVVPSLYENFPYTCLEAMACGCAVVASRTGGIPEILADGVDGLLVPPGDALALSEAIARLLKDPKFRLALGRRARQTVCERFGRQVIGGRTADAYAELAND